MLENLQIAWRLFKARPFFYMTAILLWVLLQIVLGMLPSFVLGFFQLQDSVPKLVVTIFSLLVSAWFIHSLTAFFIAAGRKLNPSLLSIVKSPGRAVFAIPLVVD